MDWDRKYPYGDKRYFLMFLHPLEKELTEQYLAKGYSRNDQVNFGISI